MTISCGPWVNCIFHFTKTMMLTWELHKQISSRLGTNVRAEEGGCGWTTRTGSDPDSYPNSRQVQGVGTAAGTVPGHAKGGEHRQISLLWLLLDMDVIGGGLDRRRRLLLSVWMQRGHLSPPQVCRATVTHQGALALRVCGELLFHLDVCAGEVLVAAHVKLQAEVTGGGERAKFTLKRLTPVLVLMYLEKVDRFKCQITASLWRCTASRAKTGFFASSEFNALTNIVMQQCLIMSCRGYITCLTNACISFNVNNYIARAIIATN